MEKLEAVNKLKKAGYQVQFDSSVVTVLISKRLNVASEIKKLKSFLTEIGYNASFGVKQTKEDRSLDGKQKVDMDASIMNAEVADVEETEVEEMQQVEEKETESIDMEVEIGEQFSLEDFGIS